MKRTTILANEELLLEAKYFAAQQGKTLTTVVREALAEYLAAHRKPRRLSFIGIGRGGEPLTAEQMDDVLRTEIDPREGWSPRRTPPKGPEVENPARGNV